MSQIEEQADRIETEATRLGWSVRRQDASTGTIYLHCELRGYQWVVRIADHSQVYRPEPGWSCLPVDPEQATVEEACEALLTKDLPGWRAPAKPELTDSEKAHVAAENRRKKQFKADWQALRETLTEADFDEFRRRGMSRATAREMAESRGVTVTQLWSALTGGRKF